ncbi:MAG: hypothetical protein HC871_02820 [Rhizobiales bacterium]|nr:hypothetical protein [Hyphomicrobiales bacterium]
MEIVGIVIAIIGALFVLFHARLRQLSMWAAVGWALSTFLLLIIALPIYLLIHGPEPRQRDENG